MSLLVGANNAGKSSVLEAAELLLTPTLPYALVRVALRRGELTASITRDGPDEAVEVRHLFFDHRLEAGSEFSISAFRNSDRQNERVNLNCQVVAEQSLDTEPSQTALPLELAAGLPQERLALILSGTQVGPESVTLPLDDKGNLSPYYSPRMRSVIRRVRQDEPAVGRVLFVETSIADTQLLSSLWDKVVLTAEEGRVIETLRLIEPDLERIAALTGASSRRPSFVTTMKGNDTRIPLGSMGEGIRRLFSLAIHLVGASGGVLLVDEIDTGLHHSVMTRMWRLIVEAAQRLNLQVLATTHSLDCVRALAAVFQDEPRFQDELSVHRIERGAHESVRYSAEELLSAAEQQMEIR